jgi:hypothetical protein
MRPLILLSLAIMTMGCTADKEGSDGWDGSGQPPDFALEDVNATSESFGQTVSPRDLIESVSGWYFAHAT